jgi:hypothetical protein
LKELTPNIPFLHFCFLICCVPFVLLLHRVDLILILLRPIHCVLSCDRSTGTSIGNSQQSAIWCLLFQFPVPSLFPKVIQYLLTSSSPPSRHLLSFYSLMIATIRILTPILILFLCLPSSLFSALNNDLNTSQLHI